MRGRSLSFDVNVAWLVAVLLMSIRMGILFYATPFDTMGRLPAQLRVYLGLMMAVVLVNALSITPAYLPSSIVELGLMGLREVMLGLVMAFGFYCAMASIPTATIQYGIGISYEHQQYKPLFFLFLNHWN